MLSSSLPDGSIGSDKPDDAAARRTRLLELVARLGEPSERAAASRALGEQLGGETVVVFLRDPEVGFLPALGFPQTLPQGRMWRNFAERCAAEGHASGELRTGAIPEPAVGIGFGPDLVLVITRASSGAIDVAWLRPAFALLGLALRGEHTAAHAKAQAQLAAEETQRAEALMAALDQTRRQLESALHDRRERQAEIEKARAVAENANRAKSDFLAMMSHELRTPLNAIAGHIQLLQLHLHGPLTAAQHDSLERIDRNQRHLLGIINDILNLARVESGRVEFTIENVVIADVLADIAPMIESQLTARQIRYGPHHLTACPSASADRDKLSQILLNLLSNAGKFTEPGGRVWIECQWMPAEECVAVLVHDTGRGIPPEKLDAIFEPFVQVDASHSRMGHGVGLGLAISRDLARGMGGNLSVRSEVGRGSIFRLTLPPAQSAPAAAAS